MNRTAIVYVLMSAALFGAPTPAAKILVGTVLPPFWPACFIETGIGIFAALL